MIFVYIPCNKVNLFTKIYKSVSEIYHLFIRGWLPCVSCALKKKVPSVFYLLQSGVSLPRPPQYVTVGLSLAIECSAQKNLWRPKHPGVATGGGSRGTIVTARVPSRQLSATN